MNKQPLISVIVPVYNAENYIAKCIESILEQTYNSFQLIVVNDGSSDNSPAICNSYAEKDSRITFVSQENKGVSAARNAALDVSRGDYITFVDSDDYIVPDALERMLDYLREYDADLCICGYILDNNIRKKIITTYETPKVFSGAEILKEYISTCNISSMLWAKMYRSSLFESIRFPLNKIHEDAYVMPEILAKAEKTVCIPDCLFCQSLSKGSITRSPFSEKNLVLLDCEQHLIDYISENYGEFSGYVAFRKADATARLMQKIIMSMGFIKYRKIYSRLKKQLYDEYNIAKQMSNCHSKVKPDTILALEHSNLFFCKCLMMALKTRIKKAAKFILKRR